MSLFDNLFDPIERLITEHGSATILREHLGLLKAKLEEQETKRTALETENTQLKARLFESEDRLRKLEKELHTLQQGQNTGFACDKCGSANIRRTGSRPNDTFGDLGVKDGLFTCQDCGHVSAYMLDDKKS